MKEFVHTVLHEGRLITFSWVGDMEVTAARVYAFALTPQGEILLVGDGSGSGYWLPGGGVEGDETPEKALARELLEEAAATVHGVKRLGTQRVDDPKIGSEYNAFYWCRVSLAEAFVPEHEVTERRLVKPDEFLDALFWGRDDPKGEMLLEQALKMDRWYSRYHLV